jgi:hemoglobin
MNFRTFAQSLALVLLASYAVGACASKKPPPPVEPQVTETVTDAGGEEEPLPQKSLYERLNGKEGVAKIVDVFFQNVQLEPKLKQAFGKTTGAKAEHFKQMMAELICEKAGGDCKYSGKSMKDAHAGMKITEDQWNAAVMHLGNAIDEVKAEGTIKIDEADKSELLTLIGFMKDEIVTVKKKETKK